MKGTWPLSYALPEGPGGYALTDILDALAHSGVELRQVRERLNQAPTPREREQCVQATTPSRACVGAVRLEPPERCPTDERGGRDRGRHPVHMGVKTAASKS